MATSVNSKKISKVDVKRAHCCSFAAYSSNAVEANTRLKNQNASLSPTFQFTEAHFSKDDKFLIAFAPDATFVAFRGTETFRDMVDDVAVNLVQTVQEGRFHKGFWDRSGVVEPCGTTEMHPLRGYPKRLVLCGHSLGGATAHVVLVRLLLGSRRASQQEDTRFQLMTREELRDEGAGEDPEVAAARKRATWLERADPVSIAFGALHFCDKKAADYINSRDEDSHRFLTFVNYDDPVPRILQDLPSALLNLTHALADETSKPLRGLLSLLGLCKSQGSADEGLLELSGAVARLLEASWAKKPTWKSFLSGLLSEVRRIGVQALALTLLPKIEELRRSIQSKRQSTMGQDLYRPVGCYNFLVELKPHGGIQLQSIHALEANIYDKEYLGAVVGGERSVLNHSLSDGYDKLIMHYEGAHVPEAATASSASIPPVDPRDQLVTSPQPQIEEAVLSMTNDGGVALINVKGSGLAHLKTVAVRDLFREEPTWSVSDHKETAAIVQATLTDRDTTGAVGRLFVETAFGRTSAIIYQKADHLKTGVMKSISSLVQMMALTTMHGGWEWSQQDSGGQTVIDLLDAAAKIAEESRPSFKTCFDILRDRFKEYEEKEKILELLNKKLHHMRTFLTNSFYVPPRFTCHISLELARIALVVMTYPTTRAVGVDISSLLGFATEKKLLLNQVVVDDYSCLLSVIASFWACGASEEEVSGSLSIAEKEAYVAELPVDQVMPNTLSWTRETISNMRKHITFLKTCFQALRIADTPVLVGVIGAEDGGKSTFIQLAMDAAKVDESKPRPEVGETDPITHRGIHTTRVSPFWLDNGFALVDFPGMTGNNQHAYVGEWKKFTHLATTIVLVLRYEADPKEPTVLLVKKYKEHFSPDAQFVVINRTDEGWWQSQSMRTREGRAARKEVLRRDLGLPSPSESQREVLYFASFDPPPRDSGPDAEDPPHPIARLRRENPAAVEDILDARSLLLKVVEGLPDGTRRKTA